ncbi:MAG TPA: tetratricopeptide repeat protein, partial [Gemmatimonadaceae bacterium]
AYTMRPSPYTAYTLGAAAAEAKNYAQAVVYFREAVTLQPTNPQAIYQLSLALALMHDLQGARAAATRVAQLDPQFPGIAGWLKALGVTP